MSPQEQRGLIHTRVLDLDTVDAGDGQYVPLRIELFSGTTLVRIRARVRPVISWLDLVGHLFDALRRHSIAGLPLDVLRYTLVDMYTRQPFQLVGMVADTYSDHLLGIHQNEFKGALDRRRRMRLLADALHALPWPPDRPDDGAVRPPRRADAGAEPKQGVEEEAGPEHADVDLLVDEPALPIEASADEVPREGAEASHVGAWSQWQRTYAQAPGGPQGEDASGDY